MMLEARVSAVVNGVAKITARHASVVVLVDAA